MTANELRAYFNTFADKFGIETPLPDHFEVDHETYANVCQFIFDDAIKLRGWDNDYWAEITLGKNNGIMFKGVELILQETK